MCSKTHAYHADEYGQGTEMIYHRVYGTVDKNFIAWEWKEDALRNVIFLEFYAIPLRIIKFLRLDSNMVIRYFIYLEQAIICLINDYFFIKMISVLFNKKIVKLALVMIFNSFLLNDIIIRPFTNSMETLLFDMMVYYWV